MTELTHEELTRCLSYNPETGEFKWKVANKQFSDIGRVAGSKTNGYLEIRLNMVKYKCHRLAWFYHYGEWPKLNIDHINRDKSDNRIINLRQCTHDQNIQNCVKTKNKSGIMGVTYVASTGRYSCGITVNNKRISLGTYDTAEEAREVYIAAKKKLHPFYEHQEYIKSPDDERRVAYVGVTRAKDKLTIVQPSSKLYFDYYSESR